MRTVRKPKHIKSKKMNIIRVLFLPAILGLFLNTACSDNSTSIIQEEILSPLEITIITFDLTTYRILGLTAR